MTPLLNSTNLSIKYLPKDNPLIDNGHMVFDGVEVSWQNTDVLFVMKNLIIIISLLFSFSNLLGADGVIIIDGFYQGKNLFVKNTIPEDGVGYSVYAVEINGKLSTDEVNSGAFEIDFSAMGIVMGEAVHVRIKYKNGDPPIVLNMAVLLPPSTFDMIAMAVDSAGLLTWTTSNEKNKLNFVVEQFKWNRWVKVGLVEGVGLPKENSYTFMLDQYSGKNKVRVKQIDCTENPRISTVYEFQSKVSKVLVNRVPENAAIHFSTATRYEVYDYDEVKIKVGYGKIVDISTLKKGAYYLYYDNHKISFGVSGVKTDTASSELIKPK